MGLFSLVGECLNGVKLIVPTVFKDFRGSYTPTYRKDDFEELGLPTEFVQDNHSRSLKDVVRGLHFQLDPPMGKLMRVTRGEAILVAVDIRPQSATFLDWVQTYATEWNMYQVWAPAGFARGFRALCDDTEVQYKCTAQFNPTADGAIRWNDPKIGVDWGIETPILSTKDKRAQSVQGYIDGLPPRTV
jgi:dTDP-4-dehydrorhamnose 3,5-epimerase